MSEVEEFRIIGHIIEQNNQGTRFRGRLVLADSEGFYRVVLAVGTKKCHSPEAAIEDALQEFERRIR